MKELDIYFTKNDSVYILVCKSDKAYIYQKTNSDGLVFFDVFLRKEYINKVTFREGKEVILNEVRYPVALDLNIWYWKYEDIEKAKEKFVQINKGDNTLHFQYRSEISGIKKSVKKLPIYDPAKFKKKRK